MKNGFFIIGAPKCGTTTIHEVMERSGEFDLPPLKELHFFSYPEVVDSYYSYEIKNNICKTNKEYEQAFINNQLPKVDNSPSYLYNHVSAQRIYEYNPSAQVIAILREPVSRSISHYLMDIRLGFLDIPFKEALDDRLFYKEYVLNSKYCESLNIFQNQFKTNFHVFLFEDLFIKNDLSELKRLGRVFDNENLFVSMNEFHENKFSEPRFKKIIKKYRYCEFCRKFFKLIPDGIKKWIKKIFYNSNANKPKMTAEKELLQEVFKEDWQCVQKFLNQKRAEQINETK